LVPKLFQEKTGQDRPIRELYGARLRLKAKDCHQSAVHLYYWQTAMKNPNNAVSGFDKDF